MAVAASQLKFHISSLTLEHCFDVAQVSGAAAERLGPRN